MSCLEYRDVYGPIATESPVWDAGARSIQSFAGDCFFGWEVTRSSVGVVVGLNAQDESPHYGEIEQAFYFSRGAASIMEAGDPIGVGPIPYAQGDRFYVLRFGAQVIYCLRPSTAASTDYYADPRYPGKILPGTVVHASTIPSYGTVFLDVSFYARGDATFNEVAGDAWYPGVETTPLAPNSATIAVPLPIVCRAADKSTLIDISMPFSVSAGMSAPTAIAVQLPFTTLLADIPLNTIINVDLPFTAGGSVGGIHSTLTGISCALVFDVSATGYEHNTGIQADMQFAVTAFGSAAHQRLATGAQVSLPFDVFATGTAPGDTAISAGISAGMPFDVFVTGRASLDDPLSAGVVARIPFDVFATTSADFDEMPTAGIYGELPFFVTGYMSAHTDNVFRILLSFNPQGAGGGDTFVEVRETVYVATPPLMANYSNKLLDRVALRSVTQTFTQTTQLVVDQLFAGTSVLGDLQTSFTDGVGAADELTFQLVALLTERVLAQSTATTDYHGVLEIINEIVVGDRFRAERAVTLADTIKAVGVTEFNRRLLTQVVSAAAAADALQNVLTIAVTETASVEVSDSVELHSRLLANIIEDVDVYALFRVSDETAQGWVVNTEGAQPISEYSNFGFNSMTFFDGSMYSARDDGLYVHGADDDSGEPITAEMASMLLDFGTSRMKRIRSAYLGYTATNELVLKIRSISQGEMSEHWYKATHNTTAASPEGGYMPVGQGLRSRYWQFELTNIDGGDFEVDQIELHPLILNRRV